MFRDSGVRKRDAGAYLKNTSQDEATSKTDVSGANVSDTISGASAAGASASDNVSDILKNISDALMRGQKKKVTSLCEEALANKISAESILNKALVDGMTRLGDDFSSGKAFVPEMLMAARCMQAATEILKPQLTAGGEDTAKDKPRVCIGTVKGDLHDIGKNLVKIMMEGSGLDVIDLGVDVAAEVFVSTAITNDCRIICCSSLLTTCMPEMRRVVELLEESGKRDSIKIMIGGAPISQSFCDEIHADAYTDDAGSAAKKAKEICQELAAV